MTQKPTVALLGQAFVAFTIEADNELERRMPHRTGEDRGKPGVVGPLIISLAFWMNHLRHIGDGGITARELSLLAGETPRTIVSRLDGLRRWGYVTLSPIAGDPGATRLVPTVNLRAAREHWEPIESLITQRWRKRFGAATEDLLTQLSDSQTTLPVGFPVIDWRSTVEVPEIEPAPSTGLASLMARALVAAARKFDAESPAPLAVALDLLRVVPAGGIAMRDLPLAAGVSKEAIAIATSRMVRTGRGTIEPDGARTKRFRLEPEGERLREDALTRVEDLDRHPLGTRPAALRTALETIVGPGLIEGLRPPPDGWRTRARYRAGTDAVLANPAGGLPWFPMVSHRGAFPDGS